MQSRLFTQWVLIQRRGPIKTMAAIPRTCRRLSNLYLWRNLADTALCKSDPNQTLQIRRLAFFALGRVNLLRTIPPSSIRELRRQRRNLQVRGGSSPETKRQLSCWWRKTSGAVLDNLPRFSHITAHQLRT